ncbi:hypothetical protein N7495_006510 [Penicillium taxi]|uniref:uncharacterized protein n=1 Tax=Penicillium taxi TaxID=168475 RepID=UPI002545029A|nr:uncharacterized protein N7495_006510 [Penicillium taxi]KAJ5894819.1 hypothetical protein N7495_006510 [Penicillium taxi]
MIRLRTLHWLSQLIVSIIVIVAAEMTIHWNHINKVNSLNSAGQTIPLAIGALMMARIIYAFSFKRETGRTSTTPSIGGPVSPQGPTSIPGCAGLEGIAGPAGERGPAGVAEALVF